LGPPLGVEIFCMPTQKERTRPGSFRGSKRIDDFEKRELIEIGVSRADLPNTVLTHEDCRMRIVKQIPGKMRQLPNHFFDHVSMAMSRAKNGDARRSEQRGYKPPS
jgi:hypothetical protein